MYKFTSPENQKLFWCPYTEITAKIFYDTRCAISEPRPEPLCWSVSKVEDMNVRGIIRLTFKQDRYNSHTDITETDEYGNIVTWCDLNKDRVPIEDEQHILIPPALIHSVITYSGIKPDIKVNGTGKKFTVKFYNDEENKEEIPVLDGRWEFKIVTINEDGETELINANDYVSYEDITPEKDINEYRKINAQFIGTDEWLNNDLRVYYISDNNIRTYTTVNIIGL